jgi:hypothetical protein
MGSLGRDADPPGHLVRNSGGEKIGDDTPAKLG